MKKKVRYALVTLVLAVMVLATTSAAMATTYTWKVPGSTGDWSTGGNWNPTGVPGSADNATVGGSSTVNITRLVSINNLTISDQSGTVQTGNTNANSGNQITLYGGITNNGTFRLSNSGISGTIYAYNSVNISGTGSLLMESPLAALTSDSGKNITNGAGHTIAGLGTIYPNYLSNLGTVQARAIGTTTNPTLKMLTTFYNYGTGVLSASPGATLQLGQWNSSTSGYGFTYNGMPFINGPVTSYIDLNGGNVNVQIAGFVNADLRNTGSGGTMDISSRAGSVSFQGTTKLGRGMVVNVNNAQMYTNAYSTTRDVVTNDGVININATGGSNSSFSGNSGNTLLTGSGKLVLNGDAKAGVGGSMTQDVNHTIEGGGTINATIVNNGTILANNGNLTLLKNISGTGQVKVQDGGRLVVGQVGYFPITLQTKDLLMSNNAAIKVDFSSKVNVAGDFSYAMSATTPTPGKWSWAGDSTLQMSGAGPEWHFLEAGGLSFVIPNLDISGNIAIVDWYNNSGGTRPEALYVDHLTFSGSALNLNGFELYYKNGSTNWVLAQAGDFSGEIINRPVVPVPPSVLLLGTGLLGLAGVRRRFKK